MKKLRLNIDNARYYSEAFIKGWKNGVEAQFKADVREQRPKGEWNRLSHDTFHCILCGRTFIVMQGDDAMNYCPNCGSKLKGADDETD